VSAVEVKEQVLVGVGVGVKGRVVVAEVERVERVEVEEVVTGMEMRVPRQVEEEQGKGWV
jgi:hypothetical protein